MWWRWQGGGCTQRPWCCRWRWARAACPTAAYALVTCVWMGSAVAGVVLGNTIHRRYFSILLITVFSLLIAVLYRFSHDLDQLDNAANGESSPATSSLTASSSSQSSTSGLPSFHLATGNGLVGRGHADDDPPLYLNASSDRPLSPPPAYGSIACPETPPPAYTECAGLAGEQKCCSSPFITGVANRWESAPAAEPSAVRIPIDLVRGTDGTGGGGGDSAHTSFNNNAIIRITRTPFNNNSIGITRASINNNTIGSTRTSLNYSIVDYRSSGSSSSSNRSNVYISSTNSSGISTGYNSNNISWNGSPSSVSSSSSSGSSSRSSAIVTAV